MSEKSWTLKEEDKDRMQKVFAYTKFVSDQREYFVQIMLFVNRIIEELKDNADISEYVELRARIKSPKSALDNDGVKALDDVFGMEVLTATEEESKIVRNAIERYMNINKARSKNINKANGYKAEHRMLTLKREHTALLGLENEEYQNIPQIEFQFKTIETAIRAVVGSASHLKYKGEDIESIQKKYDENGFNIYDLPNMWVSEKGRMRALSTNEILKKMYPYLKINKSKGEVSK